MRLMRRMRLTGWSRTRWSTATATATAMTMMRLRRRRLAPCGPGAASDSTLVAWVKFTFKKTCNLTRIPLKSSAQGLSLKGEIDRFPLSAVQGIGIRDRRGIESRSRTRGRAATA